MNNKYKIYIYIYVLFLVYALLCIFIIKNIPSIETYELIYQSEEFSVKEKFINRILYAHDNNSIVPKSQGSITPPEIAVDPLYKIHNKHPWMLKQPMQNLPLGEKGMAYIKLSSLPNIFHGILSKYAFFGFVPRYFVILLLTSNPECTVELLLSPPISMSVYDLEGLITVGRYDYYWEQLDFILGCDILLYLDPTFTNPLFIPYLDYLSSEVSNPDNWYLREYMQSNHIPIR